MKSSLLFFISSLIGACVALVFLNVLEPWDLHCCDGVHYLAIYNGELAPAPFGYRVLTPFFARLLPWDAVINFGIVSIGCLALTTGLIALYSYRFGCTRSIIVIFCILWFTSYPFVYYGTTLVRADPPVLFLVAVIFFISRIPTVTTLTLLFLISLGTLSHETMLICIPALWIDKILSTSLTGGNRLKYHQLFIITLGSIAFAAIFRLIAPALPATNSYANIFLGMFSHVIDYSGGWIKHTLRIYSAYGPAIIFAAFYATPWRSLPRSIGFFSLLLIAIIATLLATDTLRVMAIIYFPVIFYASKYVEEWWQSGLRATAVACVLIQLSYSYIVYGHLKSFEASITLQSVAAVLSLATLIFCILIEVKRPHRIDERSVPRATHRGLNLR
jgi:hypothetical protein